MGWVARQEVVWQGRRPAEYDVADCGVVSRFCPLFSLPVSVGITRTRVRGLQFSSAVKGIYFSRCGWRVASTGRKSHEGGSICSPRSQSYGMGTVGTDEAERAEAVAVVGAGHGRGTHGGVWARRAGGRGAPPGSKPYSTAGGALSAAVRVRRRVRVELRPESGFAVGDAGALGVDGADTMKPGFAAESVPFGEVPKKGFGLGDGGRGTRGFCGARDFLNVHG